MLEALTAALIEITSGQHLIYLLAGVAMGLAVGIDYALFIVTRYREGTRDGLSPHDATVRAIDTAGRAVLFAGLTVVISLLGMFVMQLAKTLMLMRFSQLTRRRTLTFNSLQPLLFLLAQPPACLLMQPLLTSVQ